MKVRIYNDVLNPEFWNTDNTLNPEIRNVLYKVAKDFYTDTELTAPIRDIIMLGSSANYNWSQFSDVDVHIVINFTDINTDIELVTKMVDALKSNYNKEHSIKIKNHAVELYIQDVSKFNRSSGVYSLVTNKWVRLPKKEQVTLNPHEIQQKYSECVRMINSAVLSQNVEELKKVLTRIYDMREVGLNQNGELSTENLVFKILRAKNHLNKLKQAIVQIYDKQVSI